MAVYLSTGLRTGMLTATGMTTALDNGIIDIYSGPQPASADAAPTGTHLVRITVASGAWTAGVATNGLGFDAAAAGVLSKAAAEVWSGVGLAAGTAGWFRFKGNAADANGISTTLARLDGSCGTSGTDMLIANTAITVGAPTTIDTWSYTLPAT